MLSVILSTENVSEVFVDWSVVTLQMVIEALQRFPNLNVCSFDKGFHSPQNQLDLKEVLERVVLPKKGRLSEADKEREEKLPSVPIQREIQLEFDARPAIDQIDDSAHPAGKLFHQGQP